MNSVKTFDDVKMLVATFNAIVIIKLARKISENIITLPFSTPNLKITGNIKAITIIVAKAL